MNDMTAEMTERRQEKRDDKTMHPVKNNADNPITVPAVGT